MAASLGNEEVQSDLICELTCQLLGCNGVGSVAPVENFYGMVEEPLKEAIQ